MLAAMPQVLLEHSGVCPAGLGPCLPRAVQVVGLTVFSQLPLAPTGKSVSPSACLSLALLSRQAPD